jgi:hypothetical protein
MNLETALKNTITFYPRFPHEEFEYIREHREEAIPKLRQRLERVANERNDEDMLFTVHLLGEFRDHDSLPFLLELLKWDKNEPYDFLGDAIYDSYPSIIAACSLREDVDLIKNDYLLNSNLHHDARTVALRSLNILYEPGHIITREELVSIYSEAIDKLSSDIDLISSIVEYSADFKFYELNDKVESLFQMQQVDLYWGLGSWLEWQEEVASTDEISFRRYLNEGNDFFLDAEEKLSSWQVFNRGFRYDFGREIDDDELCPCGSGIEFRKCCKIGENRALKQYLNKLARSRNPVKKSDTSQFNSTTRTSGRLKVSASNESKKFDKAKKARKQAKKSKRK